MEIFGTEVTMISLLFVLLSTSHAIGFLPCQRALSGDEFLSPDGRLVKLAPDEIVARGPLDQYSEPGVEAFSMVVDLETQETLSVNPNDTWHVLGEGDRVWILNGENQVITRGHHSTRRSSRPLDRRLRPALLISPNDPTRAFPDDFYARLVAEGAPAVVITKLSADRLAELDRSIAQKLEQRKDLLENPFRSIPLGSGRFHERQIFDNVMTGEPFVEGNRLSIVGAAGPIPLELGDTIHLSDDQDIG